MRRRAFLAACGVAMCSGCSELLATGESAPPVECGPTAPTWPMYGYDPARTSHVPSRALPPPTAERWRFSRTGTAPRAGGSTEAPPVVDGGVAYVAGDVRIEARDVSTGERLWQTDPGDSVSTSPVLACDALYVTTLNETLALDPADGSVAWRTGVGSHSGVSASPVAVDDRLYLATGGIAALDAETGTEHWSASTEHSVHGVAVGNRVYVGAGSNGSGEVAAFTIDGERWWRTTEPGAVYTAPAVANDTVYAVSKTGTLTALATTDGQVRWQSDVESGVFEPPAIADGRVIVGAGNGKRTMAFDARTGDHLWTFVTGVSNGAPVISGDRVLATGANTGIHLLELATGDRVRHWPVEYVGSQPVIAAGRVFYRAWNVSEVFAVGPVRRNPD